MRCKICGAASKTSLCRECEAVVQKRVVDLFCTGRVKRHVGTRKRLLPV